MQKLDRWPAVGSLSLFLAERDANCRGQKKVVKELSVSVRVIFESRSSLTLGPCLSAPLPCSPVILEALSQQGRETDNLEQLLFCKNPESFL